MKRWEQIKEAIENPSRTERAKFMFEVMEEERRIGADLAREQIKQVAEQTRKAIERAKKKKRKDDDED